MQYEIKNVLEDRPDARDGVCKRPCPKCPYRKDRANWLTETATALNVMTIAMRSPQACHMASAKGRRLTCAGAIICLQGGNSQVVSPDELLEREPCVTLEELSKRYETGECS